MSDINQSIVHYAATTVAKMCIDISADCENHNWEVDKMTICYNGHTQHYVALVVFKTVEKHEKERDSKLRIHDII